MMHAFVCATRPLGFAASLLLAFPAVASETSYKLGPQDRIRVKVTEWRANSGDIYEWTALGGEFTISAAGTASFPVIGTLPAAGLTSDELGRTLADRLKSVAGLVSDPGAAIDIVQYRPFYVDGFVEKPGEYAFRPGLTVVQAMSVAGGMYRSESNLIQARRDLRVTQGDIDFNETQRLAMMLRRDRLASEARNSEAIAFSDEVTLYPDTQASQRGMREEAALFAARRKDLSAQLAQLDQSKVLLQDELQTLSAKSVTLQRQRDLVRKELDNLNSLIEKRLAVQARQVSVEQNLAQIESQNLDLILAIQRARQEINRTERLKLELSNKRLIDINREMRETQVTLSQASDRVRALRLVMQETSLLVSPGGSFPTHDQEVVFTILRGSERGLERLQAGESDLVQPGDIVKVTVKSGPSEGRNYSSGQETRNRKVAVVP